MVQEDSLTLSMALAGTQESGLRVSGHSRQPRIRHLPLKEVGHS